MNGELNIVEIGSLLERVANPVSVAADAKYCQIGIRSHGKGLFDKEAVSGLELGEKRVFWVEPDCFVVNIVFAWEMAVARTSAKDVGKIASHRFPMFRPRTGKADVDYITYLFKTERGRELLALASPGGAGRNKTLGQNEFLKLRVAVPPFAEQKRIAEILSIWDRSIETVEALAANARSQRAALMRTLLTGRRRLPGFSGDWKPKSLGELVSSIDAGVSVNSEERVAGEGEAGVLKTSCVSTGKFNPSQNKAVVDEREIARLKGKVKAGTTIISRMNTSALVGASGYVGEDQPNLYLPDRLWAVVPERSLTDGRWLAHFLAAPATRQFLSDAAAGTSGTMKNISKGVLRSLPVLVPPLPEQQGIAEILSTADQAAFKVDSQLAALRHERSALMQQLLTGKRRVAAVESEAA
jgi:type I restriction enzyme S subunit